MRITTLFPRSAALFAVLLVAQPRAFGLPNGAPVIDVRIPHQGLLRPGDRVQVVVLVQDPDGDPVSLRAHEPPLGFAFAPRIRVPSPAAFTVDWRVEAIATSTGSLRFTADDGLTQTSVAVPFRLLSGSDPGQRIVLEDVTGDGVPDVIGYSRNGSFPTSDGPIGGLFVWPGGLGWPLLAPTISLHPASPGSYPGTELEGVHDVTGDGVADLVLVVAAGPRPIQIWRGGADLASGAPPTFTTDAIPSTYLDEGLSFGDVTGDGVDDIVAGDGGSRIFVYAGGATLAAKPSATLFVPVAPGDGSVGLGSDAIYLADVTGDGQLDVLASGENAAFGGTRSGAIYVWHGGTELRDARAPSATLYAPWGPQGSSSQRLGASGFQVADGTGDGIPDIWDQGFDDAFFWRGGPELVGRRTAELWLEGTSIPSAASGLLDLDGDGRTDFLASGRYVRPFWSDLASRLGSPDPDGSIVAPADQSGTPQTPLLHLADLDGDGLLDLLLGDPAGEHPLSGEQNAGQVQIWYAGNTLLPATPPDATLVALDPTAQARLGRTLDVADVTGDGIADVVASTFSGPAADTYVWAGQGTRFSGVQVSTAALRGVGDNVRLMDVTGDGVADVVAYNDALGGSSRGLLSVWQGGAGLVGEPAPLLAASGDVGDRFTQIAPRFADLDGDDVLDLFTGSTLTDVKEVDAAGSIAVWRGGALTSAPTVRIERFAPSPNDVLGLILPAALRDLTGDGLVDLAYGSDRIDVGGVIDAGAILFLPSGAFQPALELSVPGASQGARLGGG